MGKLRCKQLGMTEDAPRHDSYDRFKPPKGDADTVLDEIDDIKRLESWFFEIPPTNRTADPKQVKQWHKEWLAGELFENLPTDGIVVKVASGATKQKLGVTSKCSAYTMLHLSVFLMQMD